jgi:hypothetical protein
MLAEDADRKLAAGDLAAALELFTRADAIFPAPTLRLARAHILEKQGMLVESRELLLDAARSEAQPAEPPSWAQARKTAQQEADSLALRIPRLVLKIEGPRPSAALTVEVDGKRIPREALGLERPINPGKHRVQADSEGFSGEAQNIQLAEGELYRLTLKLTREEEPKPAESARPVESAAPPPLAASSAEKSPVPTLAIVGLSAGGAFTLAGAIFGIVTLSKVSDIKDRCTSSGGRCPDYLHSDSDRAGTFATLSNVGFALGAVGLGVGLYSLFSSPSEPPPPPPSTGVVFKVGLGSAQLIGRF